MNKVWDVVIVGGGLSGLALATELSAPEFAGLCVLIIEKRTHYERDRTWSYWRDTSHSKQPHSRYAGLARQSWPQWSVSLDSDNITHSSNRYVYDTVDADTWYKTSLHCINNTAHIELRLGQAVSNISTTGGLTTLTTVSCEVIQARHAFDARPPVHVAGDALVQQFEGWQIETPTDVFDPSAVELMGFVAHARGLHFWYVLPYSPRCALVENTWISPASWKPAMDQELKEYLQQRWPSCGYKVSYREQGILSLTGAAQNPSPLTRLGRGGGALRPSTGYAYLDSLAHAARIADALRSVLRKNTLALWQPPPFSRPHADLWMDAVFLKALSQDWLHAPQYFMAMFRQTPANDLVPFLLGQATNMQKLTIMRGLPKKPFLQAAWQQLQSTEPA
jgi:lycopene beta-cyclase